MLNSFYSLVIMYPACVGNSIIKALLNIVSQYCKEESVFFICHVFCYLAKQLNLVLKCLVVFLSYLYRKSNNTVDIWWHLKKLDGREKEA